MSKQFFRVYMWGLQIWLIDCGSVLSRTLEGNCAFWIWLNSVWNLEGSNPGMELMSPIHVLCYLLELRCLFPSTSVSGKQVLSLLCYFASIILILSGQAVLASRAQVLDNQILASIQYIFQVFFLCLKYFYIFLLFWRMCILCFTVFCRVFLQKEISRRHREERPLKAWVY